MKHFNLSKLQNDVFRFVSLACHLMVLLNRIFLSQWVDHFSGDTPAWRRAWAEVVPFFAFDPAIRKVVYTTNAIESLNRVIRKSIKTRGSFPTDEAATKLIYLAIRRFEKDGRNVREWFAARNQFAIMFGERFAA